MSFFIQFRIAWLFCNIRKFIWLIIYLDLLSLPPVFKMYKFDETTTEQKIKQRDILLRYWDEEEHLVVTKYLGSLTFCCATAVDITKSRRKNTMYTMYTIAMCIWRVLFYVEPFTEFKRNVDIVCLLNNEHRKQNPFT